MSVGNPGGPGSDVELFKVEPSSPSVARQLRQARLEVDLQVKRARCWLANEADKERLLRLLEPPISIATVRRSDWAYYHAWPALEAALNKLTQLELRILDEQFGQSSLAL